MTEEQDLLIRKRGAYKGILTVFIRYLDTLNDKKLSSPDVTELRQRIGKIESMYDNYNEVQFRLECIVDDPTSQFLNRSEFESLFHQSLARAQEMVNEYNKDSDSVFNSVKTTSVCNNQPVKLPTIALPKFNGSYNNWLGFHDTFTSLIHSNDSIDEINKFHYLRASLEGTAAAVIQSIVFSARNYSVAWQLLCDRFNNKDLLIQNHIAALCNIQTITKECSSSLTGLIDEINKNVRALESLGEPVKHWDSLLIYIITQKLDHRTSREFKEHKSRLGKDSRITLDLFLEFLRTRANLVESWELERRHASRASQLQIVKSSATNKSLVTTQSSLTCHNSNVTKNSSESSPKPCPKCKDSHNLTNCPQFLALDVDARLKLLPSFKVCYNCFHVGHFANQCKKSGCRLCKRRHNILVHTDSKNTTLNSNNLNSSGNDFVSCPSTYSQSAITGENNVALSASIASSGGECGDSKPTKQYDVLLSTALVKVCDNNKREYMVRAVLDSGSTSCFMTERLFNRLKLPSSQLDGSIHGINNIASRVGKLCNVQIASLNDNYSTKLLCFILPSITSVVPAREVDFSKLKIPTNICLADPKFYKPSDVDILIGADLFWDLLGTQRVQLGRGMPVLCDTRLGWIVSGPIVYYNDKKVRNNITCNLTQTSSCSDGDFEKIRSDLTRFWNIEEVPADSSSYLPEEKLCEAHFVNYTTRLPSGRFCVRIPLKQDPSILGNSYKRATNCLYCLERRLKSKPDVSKLYHEFMTEYEKLGHMTKNKDFGCTSRGYFIPHHGVHHESSSTTKLRVVFNGSSPTSSGISLNDIQMVGPTVQDDLLSILLRFRQHKYVLSADVEKMYRQIAVHPADRYLQQVLWRSDIAPTNSVSVFTLNTITYGLASSPFLATRCLKQIGIECKDDKIAEVIKHDFYVDDMLTGGDDLDEMMVIRSKVTDELASACMPLRKFKSNEPKLIPGDSQPSLDLSMGCSQPNKLLGLDWCATTDELSFLSGSLVPSDGKTKREVLSVIARIFDPLGLLSPFVITMKMLLQRMWLDKLPWDKPLSPELQHKWQIIVQSLPLLYNYRIPRIVVCDSFKVFELHVFTDASERAYGACVYVRSINADGECMVRLLMSKSRVAPLKPTTIPRLELCGALLGARIYEKVSKSLRVNISRSYCWTDSTIVLGWLQMPPTKLQPFVRNRVAEILDKAGVCTWRHVPTDQNPADLISRGIDISALKYLDLWWSGPTFLQQDLAEWPSQFQYPNTELLPETRPQVSLNAVVTDNTLPSEFIHFNRFSNYLKLVRCMAYVLRFVKRCRKLPVSSTFLGQDELQDALNIIIVKSQMQSFPEYSLLVKKQNLPAKSALLKFNIYLDQNNIIRVGGRLDNSNFSYNKKHPILLQSTHVFTKLLFDFEHKRLLHAGPQLLLAAIRESYWPIGGRNLAKACYHKCIRCHRLKGRVVTPIMGNLPQQRLLPGGYPFENCGVDYAGPVMCATRQGRGSRLVKVYISIFVCFATKAVHLELVSDLSSNKYLLALYRFISRRGKPINIYSDNGTSFVGAYNELSKFLKSHCDYLAEKVSNDGIKFHFIPAYAPHFGGIWEAGVKSAKYHLQRVLGTCHLTYEELNTTLTQIEAVLNSRPLTPLSSDPADYTPLTPGHFLVGRPLTSIPQSNYQDYSVSQLTRFQRIEQLRQHFWTRWSKEYVAELQQRTKWRSSKEELKLDTLVVIKDDHLPPLKWRLGRIVALHPGSDGVARVADIRTSAGVLRRAFNRICPLPVDTSFGG